MLELAGYFVDRMPYHMVGLIKPSASRKTRSGVSARKFASCYDGNAYTWSLVLLVPCCLWRSATSTVAVAAFESINIIIEYWILFI